MTRTALTVAIVLSLATAIALVGCEQKPPAGIKFAPYAAGYASKPDFAQVEHDLPLTAADKKRFFQQNAETVFGLSSTTAR